MNWIIGIILVVVLIFTLNRIVTWQKLYDIGLGYYRNKNYIEAMKYLSKALGKNPENPEILCCYGDSCLKHSISLNSLEIESFILKKIAVSSFIKSLRLSPDNYNSNQMIGSIRELIKNGENSEDEKEIQFVKETKIMIDNLPLELKNKFNF